MVATPVQPSRAHQKDPELPGPPPIKPPHVKRPFQFSLRTLLLSMAVVAYFLGVSAYTNLFILLPLVLPGLLLMWLLQHWIGSILGSPPNFVEVVIAGGIAYLLVCLLIYQDVHGSLAAARRSQCRNNLKQIGYALHNYHDAYGCFPPACVKNAEGRPMHSWRVLILPYMDEEALYDRYDFDEPWDGPNNRTLAQKISRIYQCPASELSGTALTSYLAVVGPNTAWPPDRAVHVSDIEDGTSNTLMVVESVATDIHWMEPRDLDVGDLNYGVNHESGRGISSRNQCCRRHPVLGANILLVDTSTYYLGNETDPNDLRAMATIAGGENVDAAW